MEMGRGDTGMERAVGLGKEGEVTAAAVSPWLIFNGAGNLATELL